MTPRQQTSLRSILGPLFNPTKLHEVECLLSEPDVLSALRALVIQLQGSGFADKHGHPIENTVAFHEAVALLELHAMADS